MRDLTRIDRIAGKLRIYWLKHPDLRLGQIVSNLTEKTPRRTSAREDLAIDIFYVEDEALAAALDQETNRR